MPIGPKHSRRTALGAGVSVLATPTVSAAQTFRRGAFALKRQKDLFEGVSQSGLVGEPAPDTWLLVSADPIGKPPAAEISIMSCGTLRCLKVPSAATLCASMMESNPLEQMTKVFTKAPCFERVGCDRIGLRADEGGLDGPVNARLYQVLTHPLLCGVNDNRHAGVNKNAFHTRLLRAAMASQQQG